MNKLPLTSLPLCEYPTDSYERRLNIKLNQILDMYRQRINALIQNPNLPEYANNAAALAGGLSAGEFYRTSTGTVMVVY